MRRIHLQTLLYIPMRNFQTTIFLLFMMHCSFISAQYYETGQDPSSIKWLEIKTAKFRVIYPESYGNEGIMFAKSLEDSYGRLRNLFPERKFRIPVIIHSYSTESNGYVAWAPKRMEIYPSPEQNSIPLGTKTQLAIHELTHVFQMASMQTGFSKAASFFLGEQFTGITSALLPLWFFEGNAVFSESVLTPSGRGRTPSFLKEFKAITLENDKTYKYDRIVNGSYKKYVPNHYHSGYQIVSYSLSRYGIDLWNKNLDYTSKYPFLADPVNISLLRFTGKTKRSLYKESFDTLKPLWSEELANKHLNIFRAVSAEKSGKYINYYSPVVVGTDSIISIKTSLTDPYCFVLTDTRKLTENRIHTPGQMYPYFLSAGGGKLAWVEFAPDPRWENRNYLIIKTMDLKTGIISTLSRKSRYMAATISPDGSKIAASENSISNINSLVIIDAVTGMPILKSDSPENASLQRPQWSTDGKRITFISLTDKGEAIIEYSILTNSWSALVDYGRYDLQSSFLKNDTLYYISSQTGTEEIHLRTPQGISYCLTQSKYGLNDLAYAGNKLLFTNYTSSGYDIATEKFTDLKPLESISNDSASLLINRFNISKNTEKTTEPEVYNPEPYRKYRHLFRFHSWMPFYADIEQVKEDPASIRPGFTLLSQNHLSTLITEAGYEFNESREHIIHSKIIWKGWYPVFESKFDYGGNPGVLTSGESVGNPANEMKGLRWINSVSLPLKFSSGRFMQYLQPFISYDYKNNYIYLKDENKFDYGQGMLSGRIFFSNYHRSSLRDIYPRLAQVFDINYVFSPTDSKIYPEDISLKTALYTPGIFPNNGLKIRFEREKQGQAMYSLNNRISFPRGYKNIISKDLTFFSADYAFPMVYPDINISSLFYLKRIRASVFGDYASGNDNLYLKNTGSGLMLDYRHQYSEKFRSFGIEMLADFHIFRLPFMISGGLQSAWKNINEKPTLELLFNIELFGMAINRDKEL